MKKVTLELIILTTFFASAQKIELIESFIGYTQKSEIISFTPNPSLIVSGDFSGNLNLWDLEKHKLIKTISAHEEPINHIDFNDRKKTDGYFLLHKTTNT